MRWKKKIQKYRNLCTNKTNGDGVFELLSQTQKFLDKRQNWGWRM